MSEQPFSQRHSLAPAPSPQRDDHLPPSVRAELAITFRDCASEGLFGGTPEPAVLDELYNILYNRLKPLIWKVLQRQPPGNPMGGPWNYYIPELINKCEWWQFYDICEEMYKVALKYGNKEGGGIFAQRANALFAREGVAWRFSGGSIERAYNPLVAETLEQARTLLQDPKYEGADEHFQKALDHLNRRPEPDKENCVKDAVGAVEATARIICGDPKAKLSDILGKEPFRSGIHPTLRVAIERLYAYRGDVGGVAHGQVGPSQVGIEEANWALTMAAATILYLSDKFGQRTK
ncbi:MAG: hypothetical protein Q8O86_04620 [Dehalococcoidia bacterium]|nr:hypothetical protein [Dehalococcoidia bacterium]